ncbi:hypothetical protein ACFQJC_17270 [Haloferax namakaokahaiae]|uniref:Uncharacterized protein n=1 Tax=Haloferax namakaokahaiae TaxID=1748331 RepID=A0ABD5ZJ31_9EURY
MVSDVIISAFVGGVAGSAITAITQVYTTNKQQKAETKRRHAEFYAGPKVKTLTDLHSALDECHRTIEDYYKRNNESVSRDDYHEEVVSNLNEYEQLLTRAGIYLNDDEKEKMENALREFRLGVMSIQDKAIPDGQEPREIDWESLDAANDGARGVLQGQMGEPIKNIES